MNESVADTMALVLRLEHHRMGSEAKTAFEMAEGGTGKVYIPAMVLAEIGYLSEKRRIAVSIKDVVQYSEKYPAIEVTPMATQIIKVAFEIDDIGELHDRLIAATSVFVGAPLLTNDPIIQASKHLTTRW